MGLPNIKVQLTVDAGERRREAADLAPGTYRLRTLEPGGETVFEWDGGRFPGIVAEGDQISAGAPAEPGTIVFDNRTMRPRVFVVEEFGWRRDVLTAHRATTMQAFRDLFDEDVLRPGDSVEIDSVALMFTDFKGSTALYERIGDSRAYRLIRDFFEVLGIAIRNHDGTIVKTIGDAVNAAFANPADGFACAVDIQDAVESFNAASGREPITVTIGLHVGRCISVTLNGQLDYYGTAANKAARLEGESRGGDIVISKEFREDPAVKALLEPFSPIPGTASLKGFDGPVAFFRISAEELTRRRGHATL
jgi:class 3 adenylate cyclase